MLEYHRLVWSALCILCTITATVKGQGKIVLNALLARCCAVSINALFFLVVFFVQPQMATYGQDVMLVCLSGTQSSSFQLVAPAGSTSLTRGTLTTNTSTVYHFTFSATAEDAGTYQCIATDSMSMVSTTFSATLTVGKTWYIYHLASIIM